MKTIRHNSTGKQPSPAQFAAKPILSLFASKHSAIWNAVGLLGGYEAARLVDRCAAELEREAAITNRVRIMLDQILAILSLENVDDFDQEYLGYFVIIDPLDPIVEEICLLTDDLRAAISNSKKRKEWAESRVKSAMVT